MKNDKQRSNTLCIYTYGGKSRGNGGAILWMFVPRIFQGAFFEMRLAREERSKILTDIRELSPPRTMRCHQSSSGKPTLIRERIFPPPRCLFIRAWSRMTLTRRKRIDVSTNTRVYSCTCIIYIYARFKSKSFSSLFETREFSSRCFLFFFFHLCSAKKLSDEQKIRPSGSLTTPTYFSHATQKLLLYFWTDFSKWFRGKICSFRNYYF